MQNISRVFKWFSSLY